MSDTQQRTMKKRTARLLRATRPKRTENYQFRCHHQTDMHSIERDNRHYRNY
ncbi:hypothetical protein Pmar_PMAR019168 [Perkinsus marinus ATCC 50983]|uniref:Uncharacterized protein n=1 Tax=Perkinsus marinus (strain ATCC 50983 / TXsc) TaxID=423536 RepID=C5KU20_PERM5|nr:hypothetical protein Pmar_PMAR019168 [Perkinsus marinus ATCC 50983]EER12062.1 hypothetical protein Pmar_PMAR019168 [Perkinsus marinus ATCC 50983]|eukprot:XP_002780267.1 hypothetical protein Pmar_PMAR019168 [Perkinsus marinus ATCC 50983]